MARSRSRLRADIKRLTDERDRMLAQVDALKNKISGIELAISMLDGDGEQRPVAADGQTPRGKAKNLLLDLLQEVGTTGLNAASAVEIAKRVPAIATTTWVVKDRTGVFVDYGQNAFDRTIASAYSIRPTPDARASAPPSGAGSWGPPGTWTSQGSRCPARGFPVARRPTDRAS